MKSETNSKSRVLIISQHFPPDKSGNASRIYDICNNLSKTGVEVIVLTPFPSFPHGNFKKQWRLYKPNKTNSNLKIINLFAWQPNSYNPKFWSRTLYYLTFPIHSIVWMLIYLKEYEIIITSAPPYFTAIPGLLAKIILRKKWIVDIRDMWIDASISLGFLKKDSFIEKLSRNFMKTCINKNDLIFVTTNGIKEKLLLNYNATKPIEIIPNGVDTEVFYPKSTIKKKQIIYSGTLGHAQDLENCILAMKTISKKCGVKFLIVGDGDKKFELLNFVKSKKLDDIIVFKEMVPHNQVQEMISESLIGVAPLKKIESLDYAIPTKVYEYMACGVPFMASGIGEIERLVKESNAGIISDNNYDSIANNIISLIEDPEKLIEMGKNGRKYVVKNYDRKNITNKIKRILIEIT